MNTKTIKIIAIVGVVVILIMYLVSVFNSMVKLDENVKAKWGNVQSDYQRRSDLIPQLVSTVKGAKDFEQQTLTQVVEARAKATQVKVDGENLSPEKFKAFQKAQGELSSALGRLLMVTENYPQLKATEAFRDLQAQLEGTENRIKVSRNDFNDAVKQYNSKIRRFPGNIFAGMFGFSAKEYFQADQGAQKAPEVKF